MKDERNAIASFLKKCNVYAEASIQRKKERGDLEEIPRWEAYIEFNQHALEEIANGTLDRWFEEPEHSAPLHRIGMDEMEHVERSIWLNSVLSPPSCGRCSQFRWRGEPQFRSSFIRYASFNCPPIPHGLIFHPQGRTTSRHARKPSVNQHRHPQPHARYATWGEHR